MYTHYLYALEQTKSLEAMSVVNVFTPVVPEPVELRVEKCPVIEASCVDKRSWPGVIVKGVESEVISPACDCFVSHDGSIAGGTEVRAKAEVARTAESVD